MNFLNEELLYTNICRVKKAKTQNYIEYKGQLHKYTIIDKLGDELVVNNEFDVRISKNNITSEDKIIPFRSDEYFINKLLKNFTINEHNNLLHSVNERNGKGTFRIILNGHIFRVKLQSYQFINNQIIDKNIKFKYITNQDTSLFEMVQDWEAFTPSTINFDQLYNVVNVSKHDGKYKYFIPELNYSFYFNSETLSTVKIKSITNNGKLIFKNTEYRKFISPDSIFKSDIKLIIKSYISSDDFELIHEQISSLNNNYLLTLKNILFELISSKFISREIEHVKILVPLAIELHEGALRHKYQNYFDKHKRIKVKHAFEIGLNKYKKYFGILESPILGVNRTEKINNNYINESLTHFATVLELSNNLYYTEQEVLDFTLRFDLGHTDGSFLDIYISQKVSYIFERLSRLTTSSRSRIRVLIETLYSEKRRHLFKAYVQLATCNNELNSFKQNLLYRTFLIEYIFKCIKKNENILPSVLYNIYDLNKNSFCLSNQEWLKLLTPRSKYISAKFNLELYLENTKLILNLSREKFLVELNNKSVNSNAILQINKIADFPLCSIGEISLESFNSNLADDVNSLANKQTIIVPVLIKEIKYFPNKNKTLVFGLVLAKDGKRTDCILQLSKTWINEFNRFGKYYDLRIGTTISMEIKLGSTVDGTKRFIGLLPDKFLRENCEKELYEYVNYRVVGHPDLSNEIKLSISGYSDGESNQMESICLSCGGNIIIDLLSGNIDCSECDYKNSFYLVLENLQSGNIVHLNYQLLRIHWDNNQIIDLFKKIDLNTQLCFEDGILKINQNIDPYKPTIDATIFTLITLYNYESKVAKSSLWDGLSALAATMKSPNSYLFRLYYLASRLLDRIGSDSFNEIDKQEFLEGISRLTLDNARFEESLESIEGIKLLEYLWREIDSHIYGSLTSSNAEIRRISEVIVLYKLIGTQFPSEVRHFKRITVHLKNLIFDQLENNSFSLLVNPEIRESSIIERILSGEIVEDERNEFKETLWRPVLTSDSHLKIHNIHEELKKLPSSSKKREDLENILDKISSVEQSKEKIKLVKFSTFKNICAMLNTRGGRIVIGIRDVKGLPMEDVGLISDYDSKIVDFDGLMGVYQSAGKTFIKDWVSMWSAYCHPKKEVFNGKEFLIIEIDHVSSKKKDLCYINFDGKESVYIRTPHGAEALPVSEIRDYQRPKRIEEDNEETSVYLMSSKTYWKIGMSNNPESRFGTLTPETKNLKHEFYAIFPARRDAKKIEDHLKERFNSKKVDGTTEFFNLSQEDVELAKSILKSQIQVVDIFDNALLQSLIS